MDYHVPATNSNKLILTQIARPVQVQQSHTVIYGTSNAREHKLEAVDTSGSGSEVACDELCSHCNVGKVEKNFTFSGVLLCLICFPFGFIWLFWMMESQCNHCGKIYLWKLYEKTPIKMDLELIASVFVANGINDITVKNQIRIIEIRQRRTVRWIFRKNPVRFLLNLQYVCPMRIYHQ